MPAAPTVAPPHPLALVAPLPPLPTTMLLLALLLPCCFAASLPIEAAFGTWLGTLHNNPTMIYVAPRTLQVEADINPFQSAVSDFRFTANFSLAPLDASLLLTRIDSALGSRFLQVTLKHILLSHGH